ncbi:hypothetical protein HII36_36865 [Nonomuraea sp. NN258]|uniref:hypothetical protein n=1 Tax=Nonomuraea antri TaxID=2730852 RepID=UPI001567DF11|nr:hypothetical protein [Nonomuraea antri]NRQ37369.1 hypothetical protein [Nonomuraea antri]
MTVTINRTRTLRLAGAVAVGWDVPLGHRDDPPGQTGRAALAARYVGEELAGDDWLRRSRLGSHTTEFSFWAPRLSFETVSRRVHRLAQRDVRPERVRALIEAQLAQRARMRADPQVRFFDTMHEAAWGWSNASVLGDVSHLGRATTGLDEHLRRLLALGRISGGGQAREEADWRGDLVVSDMPGQQCRVGVQAVLAPPLAGPAADAVLGEWLGGAQGLLARRLRAERGLAYGSAALAQEQGGTHTLMLGASGLVERLPALVAALRDLVDEIRDHAADTGQLLACADRARHHLLATLDGPFGRLTEKRRISAGHETTETVIAGLPAAARLLAAPGRLAAVPAAVACVAEQDRVDLSSLESLR